MFSRLYKYLTYRQPLIYYSGMQRVVSEYYSIGSCLIVIALIGTIGIGIALIVTTFYIHTH